MITSVRSASTVQQILSLYLKDTLINAVGSISIKKENIMKYICDACDWVYDEELGAPEMGIAPGTKFEDLPDDFECPLCGVGKDMFSAE